MTNRIEKENNYPLYAWVLTVLIAPLIWILFKVLINGGSILSWIETLPAFYIMGLIYSLPTLGLFMVIYHIFKRKSISDLILKCLLMITGIVGIFLTLRYIGGSISMELAWLYSLSMTFFIWIIKMNRYITANKQNRQNDYI